MKLKLAVATYLGLLLIGCQTTTPPLVAGCPTWEQQAGLPAVAAVSVLSPELAKVIGMQEVSTFRTDTGLAGIQATVRNCSDADVALVMRTRFTGNRGQSEPPSAWRTVHLAPRGVQTYAESAISPTTSRVAVDVYDANRGQSQFAPGQTYVQPTTAPVQGPAP